MEAQTGTTGELSTTNVFFLAKLVVIDSLRPYQNVVMFGIIMFGGRNIMVIDTERDMIGGHSY